MSLSAGLDKCCSCTDMKNRCNAHGPALDVLLVTGCVRPVEGQAYLTLKDTAERLRQYRASLVYYFQKTQFKRVIFCENSGYPLDLKALEYLAGKTGKEFETLTFIGDAEGTRSRGKGYGEGEIVAHALEHSRWAGDIHFFVKVTGRLIVRNLEHIRRRLDDSRFYINRLLIRNSPDTLDTRLYAIPNDLYRRHFLDLHKTVTVEQPLERAFMECVVRERIAFHCFPRYPEFHGVCGGDGMVYENESKALRFSLKSASMIRCFNNPVFGAWLSRYRTRGDGQG